MTAVRQQDGGISLWQAHNVRDRTLLTLGCIICYLVFLMIGRLMAIPRYPGYAASIMLHESAAATMLMIVITLIACSMVVSLLVSRVHADAGLFCAAVGLMALSVRGGPMRSVLMTAEGPRVFTQLAMELALLYVGVGFSWFALVALVRGGVIRERQMDVESAEEENPAQGLLAMATHVVVMIFLMMLLTHTDDKKQVIATVTISSMLGAIAAHSIFPSRPAAWFLAAPLIVGVLGYLIATYSGGYSAIGLVRGYMPALARPLPIDYAGAGAAASLFGYWISRKWQHERHHPPQEPEEVEEALEHPAH